MKKLLNKLLIAIMLIILLFNFIFVPQTQAISVGGILLKPITSLLMVPLDTIIFWTTCIVGVFSNGPIDWVSDWGADAIEVIENSWAKDENLIDGVGQTIETATEISGLGFLTIEDFFRGEIELANINIFSSESDNNIISGIKTSAAQWYYALRNIAAIGLLCVLIYTAIRILLSTIAEEKAHYKDSLVDWIKAVCLVIFIHVLMIIILNVADIVVSVLSNAINGNFSSIAWVRAQLLTDFDTTQILYLFMYGTLIWYTIYFAMSYTKRFLYTILLIVIAPIIGLVYAFGKEGKSIFQKWLKEFVTNAFLQPYHMLIYTVLFGFVATIADNGQNIAITAYSLIVLHFIKDAEKYYRGLFGMKDGVAGIGQVDTGMQTVDRAKQKVANTVTQAVKIAASAASLAIPGASVVSQVAAGQQTRDAASTMENAQDFGDINSRFTRGGGGSPDDGPNPPDGGGPDGPNPPDIDPTDFPTTPGGGPGGGPTYVIPPVQPKELTRDDYFGMGKEQQRREREPRPEDFRRKKDEVIIDSGSLKKIGDAVGDSNKQMGNEQLQDRETTTEQVFNMIADKQELGETEADKQNILTVDTGREQLGETEADKQDILTVDTGREQLGDRQTETEELGNRDTGVEQIYTVEADKQELGEGETDRQEIVTVETGREQLGNRQTGTEQLGNRQTGTEEIGNLGTTRGEIVTIDTNMENLGNRYTGAEQLGEAETAREEIGDLEAARERISGRNVGDENGENVRARNLVVDSVNAETLDAAEGELGSAQTSTFETDDSETNELSVNRLETDGVKTEAIEGDKTTTGNVVQDRVKTKTPEDIDRAKRARHRRVMGEAYDSITGKDTGKIKAEFLNKREEIYQKVLEAGGNPEDPEVKRQIDIEAMNSALNGDIDARGMKDTAPPEGRDDVSGIVIGNGGNTYATLAVNSNTTNNNKADTDIKFGDSSNNSHVNVQGVSQSDMEKMIKRMLPEGNLSNAEISKMAQAVAQNLGGRVNSKDIEGMIRSAVGGAGVKVELSDKGGNSPGGKMEVHIDQKEIQQKVIPEKEGKKKAESNVPKIDGTEDSSKNNRRINPPEGEEN